MNNFSGVLKSLVLKMMFSKGSSGVDVTSVSVPNKLMSSSILFLTSISSSLNVFIFRVNARKRNGPSLEFLASLFKVLSCT